MQTIQRSRLRPRLGLGFATVAITGLVLSGCSADAGDDGSQTLVVQVQAAQLPAFQYAADQFESSHEGVQVDLQTVTEEQKASTNAQIMASNNAPDIGLVPTNAQPYLDLLKADALLPLDDVWTSAELDTRYDTAVAESLKSDGTPYTVLFDSTYYNIVYYNKDAFTAAGITAPENHALTSNDQLYSIVDKLKAAGYDGLAMGGNAGYQWGWMLDGQLAANTSADAFTDYLNSWKAGEEQTVEYNNPEFTDSIAQFEQWYTAGVFPEGVLGQDGDQAQAAFTSGTAGMFLGGTWIPAVLEDAGVSFDYDWLLLPSATDGTSTVPIGFYGDTLAVPRTSKNPDLAKEFLELYVSDDVQTFAAENVGSLPSVLTVDPASVPSLGDAVQQIVAYSAENGAGIGWTSVLPGSVGQSFIDPEIQKYLGGQVTLDQVGEDQQQQFDDFKAANS